MSCNDNNNVYRNSCCPDTPYPNVQHESVPSLIDNLVNALYGEITKTVSGGRVVWDIPCDPAQSPAEVPTIPREEGEGLLCYLMRIFQNTVGQYSPFQYWSYTGNNSTTTYALSPSTNTLRSSYLVYLNGVVQPPTAYTISNTVPVNIVFGVAPANSAAITIVNLGYQPPGVIQDVTQSDATPTGSSQTQTVGAWLAYLLAQLATKLTVPAIPPSGLYQLTSSNGTVLWQQFTQLPADPLPGTKYLTSAGLNAAPIWGTIPKELPALPGGPIQQVLTAPPNGAPAVWQSLPSLSIGPITTQGTTTPRYLEDRFADTVKVEDFGAKGSFKQADTAAMGSGSDLVTVSGANFTAGDVGLIMEVRGAGNPNTHIPERQNLRGTITQVVSGTQVRLNVNAQANVSGKRVYWGYEDSAAIQAAFDYAISKGHATVEFESKAYWVDQYKASTAKYPGSSQGANCIEIRNGTVNTKLTIRGNGATIFGTNTTDPNCGPMFACNSRVNRLVFQDLRIEWDDQRRSNWYTAWGFNMYPVSADRIELVAFRNCQFVNCQYFGYVRNIFPGPAYQRESYGQLELFEWTNCEFLYPHASCVLYGSTDPALFGYPEASGQTVNLSQWIRQAKFINCYGEGCRDGIIPNDVNGPKDGFNYVCSINTTFDGCTFKNYAIEVLISELGGEMMMARCNGTPGYVQPAIGSNVTFTFNGDSFGPPNLNDIKSGDIFWVQRYTWPNSEFAGVYQAQQNLTPTQVATNGTTLLATRLDESQWWVGQSYEKRYQPLNAGDVINQTHVLIPINLVSSDWTCRETTCTVTGCTFASEPVVRAAGPNPAYPYANDAPTFRNKRVRGTFNDNIVQNSAWFMDLQDEGSPGMKGSTVVTGNVFTTYLNLNKYNNPGQNRWEGSNGIFLRQEGSMVSNNTFQYETQLHVETCIFVGVDYATITNNKFDIVARNLSRRKFATSLTASTLTSGPSAVLITCNNHGFTEGQNIWISGSNTGGEVYGSFFATEVTQNTFKYPFRQITAPGTYAIIDGHPTKSAIILYNPVWPTLSYYHMSVKDNYINNFDYLIAGQDGNCLLFDGPNRGTPYRNGFTSSSDVRLRSHIADFMPMVNGWYRFIYGWENRSLINSICQGTVKVLGLEFDISMSQQDNNSINVRSNPLAPYGASDNSLPVSKIRFIRSGGRPYLDLYVENFNHWKDWLGRWLLSEIYSYSDRGALPLCPAKASQKISAITASGTDALVTSADHGFYNGLTIYVSDTNSTPPIDGVRTVSNATQNTFTISGVTITAPGTYGEAFNHEFGGVSSISELTLTKDIAMALTRGSIQLGAGQIIHGTGVPSVAAPTGSIFIRSDGDHSTTIYVRASGSWKPLAAYDP